MMTSSPQNQSFLKNFQEHQPACQSWCFLDFWFGLDRRHFCPPSPRVKFVGQIRDGTRQDFLDPTAKFQNHRRLTGRSTGF